MFDGKTILITGGTGSLGKKLTSLILANYAPRKLIIFSRDEVKQFEMGQKWHVPQYPMRYFLGDVRDKERLTHAFAGVDYVIHAAALKQVPAAEYNPAEFIRTNILGAMNVIDAALATGVQRVVALSTDKACNPINLYGATKLCSDKLFVAANSIYSGHTQKVFAVVRYGNVAGSRGSVIPYFRQRVPSGVLPITDTRMTRFLITLDQAARFVLNVLRGAYGGEIFVPKIPSIHVTDLATAMAPQCRQIVIGIRPGEKIHEVMIGRDDSRNVFELETHYVLLPQYLFQKRMESRTYPQARRLEDDFEYNSGTNPRFLGVEEIRQMLPAIEQSGVTAVPVKNWSEAPVSPYE